MRHVQFHLAELAIGPRPLPLRHATLTVVQRTNAEALDWEVVAHTIDVEPVAASTHELAMRAITGATADAQLVIETFAGNAALVRSVDLALVFRGSGPLAGFDPERDLGEPTVGE